MVGRKLYYEKLTGDVVLTVPEKHEENAYNTTIQQDFLMYDVLRSRTMDTIGMIQMGYGEQRLEFEQSNGVRVNLETLRPEFTYPGYVPSPADEISALKGKIVELEAIIDLLLEV